MTTDAGHVGAYLTVAGSITAATNDAGYGSIKSYGGGYNASSADGSSVVGIYTHPTLGGTIEAYTGAEAKPLTLAGFSELAVRTNLFVAGSSSLGIDSPDTRLHVIGSIYANANQSGTVFDGSPAGKSNVNVIGSDGFWGIRTGTNNEFSLDVYNGGSPLAA